MTDDRYDCLRLERQVCFPLYACSKGIVNLYRPLLDRLGITYTQYITMIVLWEKRTMSVKALGQTLYLDSGTMSPVLKNLESKGLVSRTRSKEDERTVLVSATDKGMALRDEALSIPGALADCVGLPPEKRKALYDLLYEVLESLDPADDGRRYRNPLSAILSSRRDHRRRGTRRDKGIALMLCQRAPVRMIQRSDLASSASRSSALSMY